MDTGLVILIVVGLIIVIIRHINRVRKTRSD